MQTTITPVYEMQGKRRRMVGFEATIGSYTLPNLFDTPQEAEDAANEYASDAIRYRR